MKKDKIVDIHVSVVHSSIIFLLEQTAAETERRFLNVTDWPSRRCSGIRAPPNFVVLLLCQLPRLQIDRSTHRWPSWETLLCFKLLLASKKRLFSNGKSHTLQDTSSPGGSLPFCFSRSPHKDCGTETDFVTSPCSPCLSYNPCRWPAALLCWWPSVRTSFILTLAREVNNRDREHGRKGFVIF